MYPITIVTLGCKLNQLESEAIADSFRAAGFPVASLTGEPGIIIINTCTVTSKADQKSRRMIRKALRDNPASCVIVTGCYAQLDMQLAGGGGQGAGGREARLFVAAGGEGAGAAKSPLLRLPQYLLEAMGKPEYELIGIQGILESWLSRQTVPCSLSFDFKPQEFSFHSRGYLKIQDGCNSHCTYCRVRLARGSGISIPWQTALEEILLIESRGCAELMITGVNITQYDHAGMGLADLLERLLEGSTNIALRLASLEPEGIDEKLAGVLAHPRIRPHFHLCVQSGSNAILEKMGRAYDRQTVEKCITLLRRVKDNPFLACDIIAGFPGETEADFTQTLSLCEKTGFAWIHAFPYSPRPGTEAYHFGSPVCERETSGRTAALKSLALRGRHDYAQTWLGKELCAVAEKTQGRQTSCLAVSENYLKLIVNYNGDPPLPGSALRCIPVSLCEGGNGTKPDAIAERIL